MAGLEREGRGFKEFWSKWRTAMRRWEGKIREEAAKPSAANLKWGICSSPAPPEPPKTDPATGQPAPFILTAKQFIDGFIPPHYQIDGIMQRGYLYALTARTNHGKTAIAMYIAQCVARGVAMHGRAVEQGSVLFLAGENPDDIRARFLV